MARLLFTRRPLLGSSLIRAATWSGFSHVEVVIGDQLIGAEILAGVVQESLADRLAMASRASLMTIPVPDDAAVETYARSQLGIGYDRIGAIGLALHQDWQVPGLAWCSGLATRSIQAGGLLLVREEAIRRITPQQIWMLPYPIEVLK